MKAPQKRIYEETWTTGIFKYGVSCLVPNDTAFRQEFIYRGFHRNPSLVYAPQVPRDDEVVFLDNPYA